ncbi:hypothetical protein FVE85_2808 [Porphyridium purpureum]|uniref:Uncharacterized protein n=1 Tax=Porphyridium purpureum TaxID=35688 RepID=A0A5J4YVY3_PORPP|nr:hypothetical protein FVE85_2808 [Porphyridium purpureum]|eukprot:POR7053..scf227_4
MARDDSLGSAGYEMSRDSSEVSTAYSLQDAPALVIQGSGPSTGSSSRADSEVPRPVARIPSSAAASSKSSQSLARAASADPQQNGGSRNTSRSASVRSNASSHAAQGSMPRASSQKTATTFGTNDGLPRTYTESMYGVRRRTSSAWSEIPDIDHKPGMTLSLKEPAFRFKPYGKNWASDMICLTGNAIRMEMKDFYSVLWMMMRRGAYLNSTDLDEFYGWWHEFAFFFEIFLQFEDQIFYPWVYAAGCGHSMPELLQNHLRGEEFFELMRLAVLIETSNQLFSTRAPEIALLMIADVADNFAIRLLRYLATKESGLPDLLITSYDVNEKKVVERSMNKFFVDMTRFPHGTAFIMRGFKHPGEVNTWTMKTLTDKEVPPFKKSRQWIQTVHLRRVELQREKLLLFGDMKLQEEQQSDPARTDYMAMTGQSPGGSRIMSFAVGLSSGKNSRATSQAGSRQPSNVAGSRQASNVQGSQAGGSRQASNVQGSQTGGSRQASNVQGSQAGGSRQASNVQGSQAGGSRQASNVQGSQAGGSRQASNVQGSQAGGSRPVSRNASSVKQPAASSAKQPAVPIVRQPSTATTTTNEHSLQSAPRMSSGVSTTSSLPSEYSVGDLL